MLAVFTTLAHLAISARMKAWNCPGVPAAAIGRTRPALTCGNTISNTDGENLIRSL